MITLYRAAYQKPERAPEYNGTSQDTKPVDNVENGAYYYEIDTGNVYRFDEENQIWYVQP